MEPDTPAKTKARWPWQVLKFALCGVLLFALGRFVKWDQIATALGRVRWQDLLLAGSLTVVFAATKAYRWGILVRQVAPNVGWGAIVKSYLIGAFLQVSTPAGGGELARAAFLPPGARSALTGVCFYDKLVDLYLLALLGGSGLLVLSGVPGAVVWPIGGVLLLGPALLRLMPTFQSESHEPARGIRGKILLAWRAVRELSTGMHVRIAVVALLGFAILYFQAFLVLQAMVESPVAWRVVLVFPVVTLSRVIPLTPGGLGVREWTATLILPQLGVPGGAAAPCFLIAYAISALVIASAGAVALLAHRSRPAPGQ